MMLRRTLERKWFFSCFSGLAHHLSGPESEPRDEGLKRGARQINHFAHYLPRQLVGTGVRVCVCVGVRACGCVCVCVPVNVYTS